MERRPIATRSAGWAQALCRGLAASAITPNQISVLSIGFAAAGAAALLWLPGWPGLLLCALGIQLRLLCNLLDGMVAVEGGKQSPVGALYNELPDRVADSLFLVALGHACGLPWLGWLCALLAAFTAYIRVMGGALGLAQDFGGPMAKPHRMALMTAACLLAIAEGAIWHSQHVLTVAAVLIAVGSALTCLTRTRAIAGLLRQGA